MGFFSRSSEKLITIVDIGTSSVAVAIIALRRDIHQQVCPQILWTERKQINFDDNLDFKRFFTALAAAAKELLNKSHDTVPGRRERNYCFLSSPLFISQSKIIKVDKPKAMRITQRLLDEITGSEAKALLDQHPKLYPELTDDHSVILENKVMRLLLNGYETKYPYHQEAKQVEISQFVSLASLAVIGKLRELIVGATKCEQVEFHSYSFAVFSSFRDVFGSHESFISVDVSGELTDVAVASSGVLLESLSFPIGRNYVVRKVAKEFATINAEALSLIKLGLESKTTVHAKGELERALNTVRSEWLASFKETLRHVLERTLVPETLFIYGDSDLAPLFSAWLEQEDLSEFTLSNRPFTVRHLEDSLLKGFCDQASGKTDTIMLAEALFCAKIPE